MLDMIVFVFLFVLVIGIENRHRAGTRPGFWNGATGPRVMHAPAFYGLSGPLMGGHRS